MSIQPMLEPADPILDELHATRRKLLEEHGGVSGLAEFIRKEEGKGAQAFVQSERALESGQPVPPIDPSK